MIYKDFKGMKLSLLGLGAMRLPQKDGVIDEDHALKMVDIAYNSGINYFDTAYRYHGGLSEPFMKKALSRYPRDSYYLASKMPGHMMNYKDGKLGFQGYLSDLTINNISEIFEDQLVRCGVDYFDFYLLHNLSESSFDFYTNEEIDVVGYLKKQKELGRIKHLGMSAHGSAETIDKFLTMHEGVFEFVQIQLNYLDWTAQDAKTKCEVIYEKHGLPVWVMEPVRGGKLVNVGEGFEEQMKKMRPDDSIASWAFRFLHGLDCVGMILSGMSSIQQLEDNLKTFETLNPVNDEEKALLFKVGDRLLNLIPCTACRYCCDECPQKLDIAKIIALNNKTIFEDDFNLKEALNELPEEEMPKMCISCGVCKNVCPQGIDVPSIMEKLSNL